MKKMLQTNIAMNGSYDTRRCYTHTVKCHTDHSLQCWYEVFFFNFAKKFLLLSLCMHISLIFSKGSAEMHLWFGGIYNNHIIANCFENQSIIGEDMGKSKVAHFLAHST